MDASYAHQRAQALLKQRNIFVISFVASVVLNLFQMGINLTKDREVVLVPLMSDRMSITSGTVSNDYLESTTRDAALLALNRAPSALDYWKSNILRITHPSAHGEVNRELVKIVDELRHSDVTQSFAITGMRVDPRRLISEVDGVVTSYVGSKVISSQARTFRFRWRYEGVSLSLLGFEMLVEEKPTPKSRIRP
jgi:conjugal transfer pilus assembly protein TraE